MRCILKRAFILTCLNLMFTTSSMGQCKERDFLWKRLIFLRDSAHIEPGSSGQLKELLGYESSMDACPYRYDSTHALLLQRIAVLYFSFGDFVNALEYAKQSVDIISSSSPKPSVNPGHLPRNYYLLSRIYDSLGRSTEKVRAFDSCVSVTLRLKSVNYYCLTALYSKLEYYIDLGDYFSAIEGATRCESYALEYAGLGSEKELSDGKRIAANSFQWKVNSLIQLGRYDVAQSLLFARIGKDGMLGSKKDLGTMYEQLGEISIKRGNYKEALDFFNKAYQHDLNAGHTLGCKQILNNIGFFLFHNHFKDYEKALSYYRRALSLNSTNRQLQRADSIENLNVLSNIANTYVQKGNYDSAFKYFRLSFGQIRPGANERNIAHSSFDDIIAAGKVRYLTSLFIDNGDAFLQLHKTSKDLKAITNALHLYKLTDQLLNKIRVEQSDLKSRLFWRSETRRLYEHAIDACHAVGNMEDAFYFIERSRAVLLNDQLNEQFWLSAEDRSQIATLKRKILEQEREYGQIDKSSPKGKELENSLFTERNELNRLMGIIKTANSRYYQSFLDTNVISINEVRRTILKNHQALIESFVGDERVYSMMITADSTFLNQIDKTAYDSLSLAFLYLLSNAEQLNKKFDSFVSVSSSLYKYIFLDKAAPAGRVIISPDGMYFPYEALITSTRPLTYFLDDKAVSYTYSARYLLNEFVADNLKDSRNFIGIAPVEYPGWMKLPALKGSDLSLDRIKGNFDHADIMISKDASKTNFDQQFYKYKIIQLYSHASATSQYSEPIFWFVDSAMYLSDLISDHKPVTRLIVLSACETGKGRLFNGEGVFSFNRGFATLGIPSSITNLWTIENVSNYRITELFYQYLFKGLPIDVALQRAKKDFIKTSGNNKLPYYWSASILVGKSDAIELHRSFSWKWILLAAALAGIMVFAGVLLKKKVNDLTRPKIFL